MLLVNPREVDKQYIIRLSSSAGSLIATNV